MGGRRCGAASEISVVCSGLIWGREGSGAGLPRRCLPPGGELSASPGVGRGPCMVAEAGKARRGTLVHASGDNAEDAEVALRQAGG